MRCLLNYKPTKGRLRFPCHSILLSCDSHQLLLGCLVIVAFFLPPCYRISVVIRCERDISRQEEEYTALSCMLAIWASLDNASFIMTLYADNTSVTLYLKHWLLFIISVTILSVNSHTWSHVQRKISYINWATPFMPMYSVCPLCSAYRAHSLPYRVVRILHWLFILVAPSGVWRNKNHWLNQS